jgi:hypothetical protein
MQVSGKLYATGRLFSLSSVWEAEWSPEHIWTFWRRDKSLALADNQNKLSLMSKP